MTRRGVWIENPRPPHGGGEERWSGIDAVLGEERAERREGENREQEAVGKFWHRHPAAWPRQAITSQPFRSALLAHRTAMATQVRTPVDVQFGAVSRTGADSSVSVAMAILLDRVCSLTSQSYPLPTWMPPFEATPWVVLGCSVRIIVSRGGPRCGIAPEPFPAPRGRWVILVQSIWGSLHFPTT